jgi:hypothetical protein
MGLAMGEIGIPTLTARASGMRERPVIYLVDFPQGQRAQINKEYTRRNSGRGLSCFFRPFNRSHPCVPSNHRIGNMTWGCYGERALHVPIIVFSSGRVIDIGPPTRTHPGHPVWCLLLVVPAARICQVASWGLGGLLRAARVIFIHQNTVGIAF